MWSDAPLGGDKTVRLDSLDQETGAQSYRYVRTGTDHYSLAFTYDCIAWSRDQPSNLAFCGRLAGPGKRRNILTMDF